MILGVDQRPSTQDVQGTCWLFVWPTIAVHPIFTLAPEDDRGL
jgi:hypothetical protein